MQHKKICKFLNVGHGDCQIRTEHHTNRQIECKESFEKRDCSLIEDDKRFFKLFKDSTFERSRAAALEMRKIAERQNKQGQTFMLFHSMQFLVRYSNSEMLSWPNSPLLVMLQFVDPSVLVAGGKESSRATLLHMLSDMADPVDFTIHVNQLILAKQFIEHGANVNAVSTPHGLTPLHRACFSGNVTNLDFVECLLEAGADPNAQDPLSLTPLMCTIPNSPGAAKFLLNWPNTNANIPTRDGLSFLTGVRLTITDLSKQIKQPLNLKKIQEEFLLKQWREIEEMLVERGAHETGITALL
jgi:hypothetical protein